MKKLIISLISDQTLPNIQFIKEKRKENPHEIELLFISTPGMEKKGCRQWVVDTLKLDDTEFKVIEVQEYSPNDIVEKLSQFDYSYYESLLVNLTGGTKVMTMIVQEFFHQYNAYFYYVPGKNNTYLQLFENETMKEFGFTETISLMEYLSAYGFSVLKSEIIRPDVNLENLYRASCLDVFDDYFEALMFLSEKRRQDKAVWPEEFHRISSFIEAIDYETQSENQLSKIEVKFLTGEWFEEYIGCFIKQKLHLSDDEILLGMEISKQIEERSENSVKKLLGDIQLSTPSKNELDVAFVYKNEFYVIECKTSIIAKIEVKDNKTQELKLKDKNILGDTIYKSDFLCSKFGLFAKSYIFTLTDFKSYISGGDKGQQNNKTKQMEELINRAELSRITIADRTLVQGDFIEGVLKIKNN